METLNTRNFKRDTSARDANVLREPARELERKERKSALRDWQDLDWQANPARATRMQVERYERARGLEECKCENRKET